MSLGDEMVVRLSSLDCYDPDTNTWSLLANMNITRCDHALFSLNGKIYAIGGYDADSVEVYNPDDNTWTILQQKLDGVVAYTGAVLINKYYAE